MFQKPSTSGLYRTPNMEESHKAKNLSETVVQKIAMQSLEWKREAQILLGRIDLSSVPYHVFDKKNPPQEMENVWQQCSDNVPTLEDLLIELCNEKMNDPLKFWSRCCDLFGTIAMITDEQTHVHDYACAISDYVDQEMFNIVKDYKKTIGQITPQPPKLTRSNVNSRNDVLGVYPDKDDEAVDDLRILEPMEVIQSQVSDNYDVDVEDPFSDSDAEVPVLCRDCGYINRKFKVERCLACNAFICEDCSGTHLCEDPYSAKLASQANNYNAEWRDDLAHGTHLPNDIMVKIENNMPIECQGCFIEGTCNRMYRCLACNINLCMRCMMKFHDTHQNLLLSEESARIREEPLAMDNFAICNDCKMHCEDYYFMKNCLECKYDICTNCTKNHAGHDLTNFDWEKKNVEVLRNDVRFCSSCVGEKALSFMFFCDDCGDAFCMACYHRNHLNHASRELTRKEIEDLSNNLHKKFKEFQESSNYLYNYLGQADKDRILITEKVYSERIEEIKGEKNLALAELKENRYRMELQDFNQRCLNMLRDYSC